MTTLFAATTLSVYLLLGSASGLTPKYLDTKNAKFITPKAENIISKSAHPISEKGELLAARLSAFVAVLIAGYFGINPPGFVAAVVALAFGLAAASFFPAILLGIFDKRMNKEGAISGMVVGLSLMFFYMAKWEVVKQPFVEVWQVEFLKELK